MSTPRVELLWWEGCPSTERARDLLSDALRANGLDPDLIEMREVESSGDAEREGFTGSPTIRLNGEEVAPEPGDPVSLTCRVYRTRDGQVSPVPDPQDLDDAVKEALA